MCLLFFGEQAQLFNPVMIFLGNFCWLMVWLSAGERVLWSFTIFMKGEVAAGFLHFHRMLTVKW
jgi:hypothetical protein